jgi:hypothetical protein
VEPDRPTRSSSQRRETEQVRRLRARASGLTRTWVLLGVASALFAACLVVTLLMTVRGPA